MAKTISATLSHQFAVSEIGDAGEPKYLNSPVFDVVHNNVKLEFELNVLIKNTCTAVTVDYSGGPKDTIQMEYELFVISDKERISIKDPVTREFERGCGRGNLEEMPSTAKGIEEKGYLSSDGKILHIVAELSINESAFPLKIFASLRHKFSMDDFASDTSDSDDSDDEERKPPSGPVVFVTHNCAKLGFKLSAISTEHHNHNLGFYVDYVEGPIDDVVLDLEFIVIKGRKRQSIKRERNCTLIKDEAWNIEAQVTLPRADALAAAGYLGLDKKSIHLIAELSIPENAFQSSAEEPPHVMVDSLGFYLFQEVTTPVTTNSPTSNRVELISNEKEENDKTHLWAHKEVLSFASDVFKDLFGINKPQEAKMECLKEGVIKMDDLSGDALRQMMHFIYLRQIDKGFGSFALEILPVADQFLIRGLKEECERSLIDELDSMSIEELWSCLENCHTFNLKNLTTSCVETLTLYMQQNNDIEQSRALSLVELAKQRGYDALKSAGELNLLHKLDTADDQASFVPLVSFGRDHNLDVLINHSVQWFKRNFVQLKAGGFVGAWMADTSENGRKVMQLLLESMAVLP